LGGFSFFSTFSSGIFCIPSAISLVDGAVQPDRPSTGGYSHRDLQGQRDSSPVQAISKFFPRFLADFSKPLSLDQYHYCNDFCTTIGAIFKFS